MCHQSRPTHVTSGRVRDFTELLTDAAEADFAHDIALKKDILLRALSAEGPADDLAAAERGLARLAWKYHLEFDEAISWLEKAAARDVDLFQTWRERGRLELRRQDFDAARRAAEQATAVAATTTERQAALAGLAAVVVEEATTRRLEGQPTDDRLVDETLTTLKELVRAEPGDLGPSRLLVAAALLGDDPAAVIEGWRSFYHVAPDSPAPNQVAEAGRTLERLMAAWKGAESGAEARAAVVVALADSRFFTEAALVALGEGALLIKSHCRSLLRRAAHAGSHGSHNPCRRPVFCGSTPPLFVVEGTHRLDAGCPQGGNETGAEMSHALLDGNALAKVSPCI